MENFTFMSKLVNPGLKALVNEIISQPLIYKLQRGSYPKVYCGKLTQTPDKEEPDPYPT